jgi:hypothetical protein
MFGDQYPSKKGAAEARKQITAMTPLARRRVVQCF